MNFIARHLNALGLLLLTAFVATAAGMYFNVPARIPKSPSAAPATQYSCPMHPAIVANQPGDCPKCGMALTIAARSGSKPMTCQHADAATQNPEAAASDHPGCNHAQEDSAGGCCSKKQQPAADKLPGGCTRNLHPQPANPSE